MMFRDELYEMDGDKYTISQLERFYRDYVDDGDDDGYTFNEWFYDHIRYGIIKPISEWK